jgi:mono/diheme cytochrome c family protein
MRRELRTTLISAVVAGAIGCNKGGLDDARHQTGSQAMVASSDYSALYVANVDHGTVSRVDPQAGRYETFDVGSEPTRVARAGDRVFVTLRGERAVGVLRENGASLEFETKIDVGAEPFGIVANEAGDRVYVASSLSMRVDEIDAEGLTILRSFPIDAEPRWLALHPSNEVLYVGSPYAPAIIWIELDSGELSSAPLPEQMNGSGGTLTARLTGDMTVSSSGYEVAVPAVYVDNTTPIDDTIPPPPQGYYGGGVGMGGGRITPVLSVIPTSNEGEPLADYAYNLQITTRTTINGYPAAATFNPEGNTVYTPIEGSGGVIAVQLDGGDANDENVLEKFFDGGSASTSQFNINPLQGVINTGAGPRAIVFLADRRAYSYAFMDNMVADVNVKQVTTAFDNGAATTFGGNDLSTGVRIQLAGEVLSPEIAMGRRLYYASNDLKMSATFSGLSCATCHFDGRNDGLTWTFTKGGRQTPSLAGNISLTNPVRWEGDRETVQIDALRTSQDAMGGGGFGANLLTEEELDAIAAYVDFTRDVDLPSDGLDAEAVARGKSIFERSDVGCAGCHVGPRYTNNQLYSMFGMSRVKTRPLVGIAATAPYLHDGSAKTLRDVLELGRTGAMGNTSALSDGEMNDLETYLRSL